MSIRPHPHRLPRARIDPIVDPSTALRLVRAAMALPPRPETIVVLLDDAHRGIAIVSVDGTPDPDQVVAVVECLAIPALVESDLAVMIVASVRPGDGIVDGDGDRWFEMCDVAEHSGAEIVEWFVLGRAAHSGTPTGAVSCPRDLVGVPPRWPTPDARPA